jgi:hypothetical protein
MGLHWRYSAQPVMIAPPAQAPNASASRPSTTEARRERRRGVEGRETAFAEERMERGTRAGPEATATEHASSAPTLQILPRCENNPAEQA